METCECLLIGWRITRDQHDQRDDRQSPIAKDEVKGAKKIDQSVDEPGECAEAAHAGRGPQELVEESREAGIEIPFQQAAILGPEEDGQRQVRRRAWRDGDGSAVEIGLDDPLIRRRLRVKAVDLHLAHRPFVIRKHDGGEIIARRPRPEKFIPLVNSDVFVGVFRLELGKHVAAEFDCLIAPVVTRYDGAVVESFHLARRHSRPGGIDLHIAEGFAR